MSTVENIRDFVRESDGRLSRKGPTAGLDTRSLVGITDSGQSNRSDRNPALVADPRRLVDTESAPVLARFFELADETIDCLEACRTELASGEKFAADDSLMRARELLSEAFMTREVSESVALITLRCLQAAGGGTILDCADHLNDMLYALRRLRAQPYMQFVDAMDLVRGLPKADPIAQFYNQLTSALVDESDDQTSDKSA
jgi:hypothetical protein